MTFETRRPFATIDGSVMNSDQPERPSPKSPPLHFASDLTQGGRVAHVQHGDQVYTLRITKAEKLILTK